MSVFEIVKIAAIGGLTLMILPYALLLVIAVIAAILDNIKTILAFIVILLPLGVVGALGLGVIAIAPPLIGNIVGGAGIIFVFAYAYFISHYSPSGQ